MKRLSKEERLGAITLAAVVVAVIGGSMLLRNCSHNSDTVSAPVTILYQAPDSTETHTKEQTKKPKLSKSGKSKKDTTKLNKAAKSVSKRKNGRMKVVEKNAAVSAPRDFLRDTIPTRR